MRSISDLRRALRSSATTSPSQTSPSLTPSARSDARFAYDNSLPPWNSAHPDPFTRAESILLDGFTPDHDTRTNSFAARSGGSQASARTTWPDRLAQPLQSILEVLRRGQSLLRTSPTPTQASIHDLLSTLIGPASRDTQAPTMPSPDDTSTNSFSRLAHILHHDFFIPSPDHTNTIRWHSLATAYQLLLSFSARALDTQPDSLDRRQGITAYAHVTRSLDDLLHAAVDALDAFNDTLSTSGIDPVAQDSLPVLGTPTPYTLRQILSAWHTLLHSILPSTLWAGAGGLASFQHALITVLVDTNAPLRDFLESRFPARRGERLPAPTDAFRRLTSTLHVMAWTAGLLWSENNTLESWSEESSRYLRYKRHKADDPSPPSVRIAFSPQLLIAFAPAHSGRLVYIPRTDTVGQWTAVTDSRLVPSAHQHSMTVSVIHGCDDRIGTADWRITTVTADGAAMYLPLFECAPIFSSTVKVFASTQNPIHIS